MGSNEQYIKSSIVRVCQKLDSKGFGANHDGNVSVKYGERIFATPTAVSKGDIQPEMIIQLDLSGTKIAGHGKPFSEIQLHLAAYNSRPDIAAVVHAHPPYSTARGLARLPLTRPTIPESVVSIGDDVPVARFAMPGDTANTDIVGEMLQISNVFMMPGNGVLSVGTDVVQAYLRLELVEHLAKIDFIATHMGEPTYLSDTDIAKLLEKNKVAGLCAPASRSTKQDLPAGRQETRGSDQETKCTGDSVDIRKIIAEEVIKVIGQIK